MEPFNPDRPYRPEDEYEALDNTPAPENVQPQNAAQGSQAISQGSQPFVPPVQPAQPAQQPMQQPAQQQYSAPMYPQQQYPQQPAYRPPMNQSQSPQQPAHPMNQPQYGVPVYPQQSYMPQQQQQSVPYPQQPTQQPVQNNMPLSPNPYAQSYPNQPQPMPVQQKPATPTGTKVFIIILCALLAAMVIGFIVYVASTANKQNQPKSDFNNNNGFSIDGGNGNNGSDPFGGIINNGATYSEVEDEITLKADNGDTQKRSDDNQNSVGSPDEKAKNITLSPLPKDKDDEKYTTQSAYETVSDSVVTVVCYQEEITDNEKDIVAQGTGTIISEDGYIITNAHVIGNSRAYAINIVLNNKDKYPAKVVGYDTWTDLAVLKIDSKDLKAVSFGDSDLIEIGQDVIAVGSPGGEKFQNSLTKGIVSAVDRELSVNRYVRYIQSDAAISPGNSGGPLCNIYGQVIGITTAKTVATYYENMTFSIPSKTVEEIVGDLMHYGYVKGRCRIGITGTELAAEEYYYSGSPSGIVISEIDESGSLAGTKLKSGDIITELDGQQITSFQDIYDVLADHKEGDKVTIKAQRPSN